MNWNPLKRLSLNHHHKLELDSVTQCATQQLERLVAEFDSAENIIKSLHQSAKKLIDQILCIGKFETKLTDDLSSSNLFSADEQMKAVTEEWHSLTFVSNTIGDEFVINLQKNILEPLKQLKQAFTELRAQIRLHDSIQLDVIKFQRKVATYNEKEKTGANLVKLQENKQSLAASQREFANRTHLLLKDLGKFLMGSSEMLQPLLEGFIAAEIAWVRACKKSMDSRTRIEDTLTAGNHPERLKKIENTFRALNDLSICSEQK